MIYTYKYKLIIVSVHSPATYKSVEVENFHLVLGEHGGAPGGAADQILLLQIRASFWENWSKFMCAKCRARLACACDLNWIFAK